MKKTECVRRMLALLAAMLISFTSMPVMPVMATQIDDVVTYYDLIISYDTAFGSIKVIVLSEDGTAEVAGIDTESGKTYKMEAGKKYAVEITAAEGYQLTSIDANGVSQTIENPQQFTYTIEAASEDCGIAILYEAIVNPVSVVVEGSGMIAYTSDDGSQQAFTCENATVSSPGIQNVVYGADATFTFIPANGYYVSGVRINDCDIDMNDAQVTLQEDGSSVYKFAAVKSAQSIYVEFSEIGNQVLTQEKDETIEEMLARGNVEFIFSKNADRNNQQQIDETTIYTLTHHQKVTVAIKGDENCGYQILNNGSFVASYDIEKSAEGLLNQYVVRRTMGAWEGSVVRYCTGHNWNFVIDNNAPGIQVKESSVWLNGTETELEITGEVADDYTGIKKVVWYTQKQDIATSEEKMVAEATNVAQLENGKFCIAVDDAPEKDTTYYIYAIDEACNIAEAVAEYHIDTEEPDVTVEMEDTTRFWHKLFWNKNRIDVTVLADDGDGSGVDTATLFVNGEEWETKPCDKNGTYTFTVMLKEGEEHTFTAIATDKVGNKTAESVDGGTVCYDNELPTVEISIEDDFYEKDDVIYSSSDISMKLQVEDKDSGLAKVEVLINGQMITADVDGKVIDTDYTKLDEQTFNDEFRINTALGQPDENGRYAITVNVYDVAGNLTVKDYVIYKDETAPEITVLQIKGKNAADEEIAVEGSGAIVMEDSEIYGYYAADELTINVTACDGDYGSGASELSYMLKNADGTTLKSGNIALNGEENATITVPADFKGSVYVKGKDQVGNVMANYVTTDCMIAESQEQFDNVTDIMMTAPETNEKDIEGNNLYADDVTIPVVVTESYAGIRSIEWNVVAPQDEAANQSGTILIDNKGNSSDENWKVKSLDCNLATCVEGRIPVSANSNAVVVTVKLTDRAGYVTTQNMTISIDKTAPVVEIQFDKELGDATYTDYFAETRTATVTIKERNFDKEDVMWDISNTDGSMPVISEWTSSGVGTDDAVHTVELVFAEDGDYKVSMQFMDMAGNRAISFDEQSFTIDKTKPEIEVSFDNNQSTNGNYYSTERTAIIRVNEHNFDATRIEIVGMAMDGEYTTMFPITSSWSEAGDVYTATLTFDYDGLYFFEVSGLDKAGNESQTVEVEEFYVDLTDPLIEISGVEDRSANNGAVEPVIMIMDTNYSKDDVEIELVGANRGLIKSEGTFTTTENGQIFQFEDFAEEQEVDDIYTLTATATDMAGNTVSESITFSVNRFGSVYTLDRGLKQITGSYIREAVDIVLTETNADTLDESSIEVVLSANGTPRTLEKGVDYTIEKSGGEGSWNQYEYQLYKENFEGDGTYKVTIYSVDAAGNINETVDETKKAEIEFGVDGTAPVIVPLNIEEGGDYNVEQLTASISVQDNLVLEDVKVMLNGETVECQNNGDTYEFVIPEDTKQQSVVVLAQDAAGNTLTCEVTDVLVSTNDLVRWYNNKPLFAGTLAGTGAAAGGVGAFFTFRRKNLIRIKRK